MKTNKKLQIAAFALALSSLYACSHGKRDLASQIYKDKWGFGKMPVRSLASDESSDPTLRHSAEFTLYNDIEMPHEVSVFRGNGTIKTRIVVHKKDWVRCWTGATKPEGIASAGDEAFDVDDETEVKCSYDGQESKEVVSVDYVISKSDLSYKELNSHHDQMVETKAKIEKGEYDQESIRFLKQIGLAAKHTRKVEVQANDKKGTGFFISENDFVEFGSADGKAAADKFQFKKKPLGPEGISGKELEAYKKQSKYAKKSYLSPEDVPFSLLCNFVPANGNPAYPVFKGADPITVAISKTAGNVNCFVNAKKAAYWKSHQGSFSVDVVQLKKSLVVEDLAGLIKNERGVKASMDEKKDKENFVAMKRIVANAQSKGVALAAKWERFLELREQAKKFQEEQDKLKKRIGELEEDEETKKKKKAEAEKAEREQAERELAEKTEKFFPKHISEKVYRMYFSFWLKDAPYVHTLGEKKLEYLNLIFENGYVGYFNGSGDVARIREEVLDPVKNLLTKDSYRKTDQKQYVICANKIARLRNVVGDLKERSIRFSDVEKALEDLHEEEWATVCRKTAPFTEDNARTLDAERQNTFRFCYKKVKERRKSGPEIHDMLNLVPLRIEADYEVAGGDKDKPAVKVLTQKSEHPFFKNGAMKLEKLFQYSGKNEICKDSDTLFPEWSESDFDAVK